MAKRKNTISDKPKKKDYHKPKKIKLADGTEVMERYHNDHGSKAVYQKVKKDPEASKKPIDDEFAKLKFPPPKRNPVFRKTWAKFIDSLTGRDSFREAHLATLEVLCDLYVEYQDLEATIRKEGRTFKAVSRWGELIKMHPAVSQLDKVRANIAKYTKQLDLFPKKDSGGGSEGEEEAWS